MTDCSNIKTRTKTKPYLFIVISGTTDEHPKTGKNTLEHIINKYGHKPRMIFTTVNSQQNRGLKKRCRQWQ